MFRQDSRVLPTSATVILLLARSYHHPSAMRTILHRCIISALVFTHFFLSGSSPIPGGGSAIRFGESSNNIDQVPTTASVVSREFYLILQIFGGDCLLTPSIVPVTVERDDELGLLVRDSTDNDSEDASSSHTDKSPIKIPRGFRPDGPSSDTELEMKVPPAHHLSRWGSVLNIVNLMVAAAKQSPDLEGPLDIFKKELGGETGRKSLKAMSKKLQKKRPTASRLPETKVLNLGELRSSIEKAVKSHNEFNGEIQIPATFVPGTVLSMKVPDPNNALGVQSVENCIQVMRIATADEAEDTTVLLGRSRMKQLTRFRMILTQGRHQLTLPSVGKRNDKPLTKSQLRAIQKRIKEVVEQHNDNQWVLDVDLTIPEIQDGEDDGDDCPDQQVPLDRKRIIEIPRAYFVLESRKTALRVYVPSPDDKNGLKSMNDILELMAHVGGSKKLRRSWKTFRNSLEKRFGLQVIENPHAWGPEEKSKRGNDENNTEERKKTLSDAVEKHQANVGCEEHSRRKRKSVLPHDQIRPNVQTENPLPGKDEGAGKKSGKRASRKVVKGTGTTEAQAQHKKGQARPPQSNTGKEGTLLHHSQKDVGQGTGSAQEETSHGSAATTEPAHNSVMAHGNAHDQESHISPPGTSGTVYFDPVRSCLISSQEEPC
ncbi:hypothetical protein H0H93_007301 [Arthromyces matolae]|nr:hypothetical protein H0H93_007301 [Arthromyces matolae]